MSTEATTEATTEEDFTFQYNKHYAIVLDCIMYSEAEHGIRKCLDRLYADNKDSKCEAEAARAEKAEECRARILTMIKLSWIDCDHEVLLKSVNWICDNLR